MSDLADQARASWRIGEHYQIHVYEGERPVATFHAVVDAKRAVDAVNSLDDFRVKLVEAAECIDVAKSTLTFFADKERTLTAQLVTERAARLAAEEKARDAFDELSGDLLRRRDALTDTSQPRIQGKRLAYEHAAELVRAAAALATAKAQLAAVRKLADEGSSRGVGVPSDVLLAVVPQPEPAKHEHAWTDYGVCYGCDSYDRAQDKVLDVATGVPQEQALTEPKQR